MTFSFTMGAWIGIGVGLLLAIVEYLFVVNVARQNVKSDDPEVVDRTIKPIKMLMAAGFVILPIVGFLLGNILVDQGLLPR